MNSLYAKESKNVLLQLSCEKRVIMMIRLLSNITSYIRITQSPKIKQEEWDLLCDWLMTSISLDLIKCTSEIQEIAIYWLNDCEIISNYNLHFELANRISDCVIKNSLLDEAISIVQKEFLNCSYEKDVEDIISLYLKAMNIRYGQDSEKEMFKQVVDWSVFEIASEPELKNYAYDRWHRASIRAKRQLQLFYAYLEMNPNSVKTKKYVDMWENRIK